ncbi:MAG: hypothetical protein ACJ759_24145 [Thermoanaerobaculia bacterium]
MARSTLRCAAGIVLAVTLLLPGMAAAREIPSGRPAEPVFSLIRLWTALVQSLPIDWRPMAAFDQSDTSRLNEPDGDNVPPDPGTDTGWLVDPDG